MADEYRYLLIYREDGEEERLTEEQFFKLKDDLIQHVLSDVIYLFDFQTGNVTIDCGDGEYHWEYHTPDETIEQRIKRYKGEDFDDT